MKSTLAILAGVAHLLAAGAATADHPTCDEITLPASAAELTATPREHFDLEVLAFLMGDGVTADQATYDRVVADVDLIRAVFPPVSHVTVDTLPLYLPDIFLSVDAWTKAAILAGTYTEWDCLNAWYGFELTRVLSGIDWVLLSTQGVFDLPAVISQYAELPGILGGEPNQYIPPGLPPPPPPTICGIQEGSRHHYFFAVEGGWPVYYFTTRGEAPPQLHGVWDLSSGEDPSWRPIRDACRRLESPLPSKLEVAPASPTTADGVVLTASGEYGNSACGPFFDSYTLDPETRTIRVVADFNPGCGACTVGIKPYAFDVPVGTLAAGEYQVIYLSRDGCGGGEHLEATARFTVRSAAQSEVECGVRNRPAATLLLPYFEVDLAAADGLTTLFSVNNVGSDPVLARVVLWTDWGLPTLGFTLYLGPAQVQAFNLHHLLVGGLLPETGTGTGSIPGAPGCSDPIANPELDAAALAILQAQHTGQPSPADGLCHGSPSGDLAVGYVTVDVVGDCSATVLYPGDEGYFGKQGLARDDNVLWGDLFLVDPSQDAAQGIAAVTVVADPAAFAGEIPGASFYEDYVGGDGSDHRLPLATEHRNRYLQGGGFDGGTEVLVWTAGLGPGVEPLPCVEPPSDAFSVHLNARFRGEEGKLRHGVDWPLGRKRTMRLEIGAEPLVVDHPFGQIEMTTRLNCSICSPPVLEWLQGWVTPVLTAADRYSLAYPAVPIPGSCPP